VAGRSTRSLDVTKTVIEPPPPVLNCARVLEYAEVYASVKYTGRITVYVDRKELGPVPRLAICENLNETSEVMLFYCDNDWNVLGAGGAATHSLAAVRENAEKAYAGISAKWIKSNVSRSEAEEYLSESWGDMRCGFCGRTPNQVQRLVEGKSGARICDVCISELKQELEVEASRDV
jgi:hypothetical protein